MKTYVLKMKQFLPISLELAWDFFSSPKNLALITPKRLNFEIDSISGAEKIHQGQIIQYRVTIFPLVRMLWETEITSVNELHSFSDIQRKGPYKYWNHKHTFSAMNGGVEMTDELEYSIPFGFLGTLANCLFVSREVKSIFKYRFGVLEKHFKIER